MVETSWKGVCTDCSRTFVGSRLLNKCIALCLCKMVHVYTFEKGAEYVASIWFRERGAVTVLTRIQ